MNIEKYTDVIIDLETWSLRPDAAIRSIGACAFNIVGSSNEAELANYNEYRAFYKNVSEDNLGHIDPKTVAWWHKQSFESQDAFAEGGAALGEALEELCVFVASAGNQNVRVWSNGAAFDLPILRMAASRCLRSLTFPWSYKNERDTRTLYWLACGYKEPEFVGEKHNAVHDAVHEAKRLQSAYAFIDLVFRKATERASVGLMLRS